MKLITQGLVCKGSSNKHIVVIFTLSNLLLILLHIIITLLLKPQKDLLAGAWAEDCLTTEKRKIRATFLSAVKASSLKQSAPHDPVIFDPHHTSKKK